jgi:hypothetical protein
MPDDRDHYEAYYAEKLWALLPAVYRAEDTDAFDQNGPLRELVNRIGVQAAILRRSIDRMWEDQSIESCDDWIIPYIGDLLATNLVASLDARGQRLDVAKTIYYRRRKGTVALLEELAHDITGWEVRVVEFFRRLARTRHGFDPEIGLPSATTAPLDNRALQLAEGLIGPLTNTCIGGWADLRKVYGALQAQSPFGVYDDLRPASAFDEYFHTADFRRGRGRSGWYNIPRLGVFVWRLYSFPLIDQEPDTLLAVPVQNADPACTNHYSFDPTGREAPLFAAAEGVVNRFGSKWVSPDEWQLPTPISQALLNLDQDRQLDKNHDPAHRTTELYAVDGPDVRMNSLGVFRNNTGSLLSFSNTGGDVSINPERGTLTVNTAQPNDPANLRVWYHYGFSSTIGAGAYSRRVRGQKPVPLPSPVNSVSGGGNVPAPPATGTMTITDSLTYDSAADVGSAGAEIQNVTIWANSDVSRGGGHSTRPLIRLSPAGTEWIFTGGDGARLQLEGLFLSGGDIVLKGKFDKVSLTCCTFDPGNSGTSTVFRKSIDQRDLVASRLWIEAEIRELEIDRCIVGPVRTRGSGEIEKLTITDSIVQSIRTAGFGAFATADIKDASGLLRRLGNAVRALCQYLRDRFSARARRLLTDSSAEAESDSQLIETLVKVLNRELKRSDLFDPNLFRDIPLTPETQRLVATNPTGSDLVRLNRSLLEEAFPVELADNALALGSGEVRLVRTTVMGPAHVHRLDASECILDGMFVVDDDQHGCVRFSAWCTGSVLPRKYESVEIAPDSPLFVSRVFGQPGYAQLMETVDAASLPGQASTSISEGAQDGSEMGAFSREKNPIKERSLLIKYDEFMPIGLVPVIIHVT